MIPALFGLGIGLRLWQYAANASLWFDEFSIARNIYQRNLGDLLTQPLRYQQIAPVGFIALVKGSTLVLGPSDLALRLVPFVCGLLALVVFWRVASRVLDPVAAPLALGLFALGLPFILYTAVVKQYGLDILATLVLVSIALDLRASKPSMRQCISAGLAGVVIPWFSQAALLVMAVLGALLVGRWLLARDGSARRPALVTVPIWAISALLGLWLAWQHTTPEQRAYMHQFWGARLGFFPLPPRQPRDALWLWDRIHQLFAEDSMLEYPLASLYEAIALLGIVVLWRERRDITLIVIAPLLAALAAAVAQQYPFLLRVALFVIPTLVLLTAAGIRWIGRQAARLHPVAGVGMMGVLAMLPVYAIAADRPPYSIEDFKTVLAHVQANRRPDDVVYAFVYTYEAMVHYGPRYGLKPGQYIMGTCDERDSRRYLEDVDRLRGHRRVWIIEGSVPRFAPPRQSIVRYLGAIGILRDSIAIRSRRPLSPVSARLFNLSDTTRLRAASAATFPVTPVTDTLPPRCNDRVGWTGD